MEAALRTAQFYLSGNDPVNYRITELRGLEQVKIAKLPVNGMELGVAVISGLGNVKKLLEEIRGGRNDIHFIEVMTCPGGCIAGGGQFINAESGAIRKRIASLYAIDDDETLKFSHKNPEIIELYEKFLVKPLGHNSHELLHTRYQEREVMK
jgi:iron only hydrogenase large subunit-like protein